MCLPLLLHGEIDDSEETYSNEQEQELKLQEEKDTPRERDAAGTPRQEEHSDNSDGEDNGLTGELNSFEKDLVDRGSADGELEKHNSIKSDSKVIATKTADTPRMAKDRNNRIRKDIYDYEEKQRKKEERREERVERGEKAQREDRDRAEEKEEERVEVVMVSIGLKGSGKACDVVLHPPALVLPGSCVLGQVYFVFLNFFSSLICNQTYTKMVQIINGSTSAVNFAFKAFASQPNISVSLNHKHGTLSSSYIV